MPHRRLRPGGDPLRVAHRLPFQGANAAETLHLVRPRAGLSRPVPAEAAARLADDLSDLSADRAAAPLPRHRGAGEDLRRLFDVRPILARTPSAVRRTLLWSVNWHN